MENNHHSQAQLKRLCKKRKDTNFCANNLEIEVNFLTTINCEMQIGSVSLAGFGSDAQTSSTSSGPTFQIIDSLVQFRQNFFRSFLVRAWTVKTFKSGHHH